jgi:hypothetical protein
MIGWFYGTEGLYDPDNTEMQPVLAVMNRQKKAKRVMWWWIFSALGVVAVSAVLSPLVSPLTYVITTVSLVCATVAIVVWQRHQYVAVLNRAKECVEKAFEAGLITHVDGNAALYMLEAQIFILAGYRLLDLLDAYNEDIFPIVLAYIAECRQKDAHPLDWNGTVGIRNVELDTLSQLASKPANDIIEAVDAITAVEDVAKPSPADVAPE